MLGNQDMQDVPFSFSSYTRELIENRQSQNIGDVLRSDPAVRQSYGFGNFSQVFVIRGFALFSDDIAFNGLYGVLPRQIIATEAVERVEVFRAPAPSSMAYRPAAAASAATSTSCPSAPRTSRPAA